MDFKAESLTPVFAVGAAISFGSAVACYFLDVSSFFMLTFPGWERLILLGSMGRLGMIGAFLFGLVFVFCALFVWKRTKTV